MFANKYLFSDVYPFEIIKSTKQTISIRQMKQIIHQSPSPFFKQPHHKEIVPDLTAKVERAYLRKDGKYYHKNLPLTIEDKPVLCINWGY